MPTLHQRVCGYPGCGELTTSGYCGKHKQGPRNRQGDRLPTNSKEWTTFIKYLKSLGNVVCQSVSFEGFRCDRPVWGFHHILPATEYHALALCWRNVVGVCLTCHNAVEADPKRSSFVPTLYRTPMSDEPVPMWSVQPGAKAPEGCELWTPNNRKETLLQ